MNTPRGKIRRVTDYLRQTKNEAHELLLLKGRRRAAIALVALSFLAGWLISGMLSGPKTDRGGVARSLPDSGGAAAMWTCSMHPQIQLPRPGQCPLCAMDLIPVHSHEEEGMPSSRRLVISREAAKLAEIQTAAVERKFAAAQIRMTGKVEYDETRIAYISAWTSGRLDRLYVNQTGIPIRQGEHLALIYSPELLSAQEEYLQAIAGERSVRESHLSVIRTTSANTVRNAREKLKLLGVTDEQIKELEERKTADDRMTVYSTVQGIVAERFRQEGDYVETGSRIYAVVDLSRVWVQLDAYEKDLVWLRYGQDVEFEAEAYPGETFYGRISFIDPVLDRTTRTVKVRVNAGNENGWLKPGMFVRAVVDVRVAGAGRVMAPDLEGKWMCSMHPEILQDESGHCPVCEMPLVPVEKMGYITGNDYEVPLVIPVSAVLKTGKRAVVYVQDQKAARPAFEGREIVLGPRAGGYYLVRSGLQEGERVVTQGSFKIDSALQIQARPSMMNPEGGVAAGGHDHGGAGRKTTGEEMPMKHSMAPQEFLEQLSPLYEAYFELQNALAADDFEKAMTSLESIKEGLNGADMNLLEDKLHAAWMDLGQRIDNSVVLGFESKSIEEFRQDVLEDLSVQFISLEKTFGHVQAGEYYKVFCPMALDGKGAAWLQSDDQIMNPFYGKKMQRCGIIQDKFLSRDPIPVDAGMKHETDGGSGDEHAHG